MTQGASLQGLSLDAARCIFEFAYLPAQYADPERLVSLKPALLDGVDAPVERVSRAIAQTLGLPDLDGLDTAQPLHRAALLPHDVIRELAWCLGLRSASAALRKLVLREDLNALEGHLRPAHWSWVFRPFERDMPLAMATESALQQQVVAEWPPLIWRSGWDALVRICLGLPRSIGQRLWLKLPVQTPDVFALAMPAPDAAEMQSLTLHVAQAYDAVVQQWSPQWDRQWSVTPNGEPA
ncbi:MAG: SctK family type III secretion system sorting platform protein [Pseudomonadota bacterium]